MENGLGFSENEVQEKENKKYSIVSLGVGVLVTVLIVISKG